MHATTPEPKRIAQYEILETLASLDKVRIYRAGDSILQRTVTLKTIPKDAHDSNAAAVMARFQNQARTSSCLNHPGIVSVYQYGEDGALAFVVLEYVEGCALKERVRMPISDAGSIIMQLLVALDYAHEQGVVHGNLKPSNLLLTSKGQLRITDFGCADSKAGPTLYMSPERLNGAQLDHRSDIFSAGVLTYELLTGVSPFPGPQETIAHRVCHDREHPASEVNGNVPRVFDSVCSKALTKVAAERYETARAFAEAFRVTFENAYSAAPRDLVSNESVVSIFLSSLRGPSKRRSASTASAPKAEPQKPPVTSESTWEAPVLRMVERQLAAFVGPLARLIVKEAASKTQNIDELYSIAAESLERDDDRRLFLARRKMINQHPVRSEAALSPRVFASPDAETAALGPELLVGPEHAVTPNSRPAPAVAEKTERNIGAGSLESVRKESEEASAAFEGAHFADTGPKELNGLGIELNRETQPQLNLAATADANSADRSDAAPQVKSGPQQAKREEDVDNVKEWCSNEADSGKRYIMGGAWNEPDYPRRL